ncbi:MAG: hypothetical protein A3H96_26350 [Acidobacteria bacterium RIFCSPLOWO2_02_FULL_67_36]|nr:MAG: hypothetical protein A3H96_26350 [Acidobacteria bacterium RIFCSPLOWO2_02_FULL_67_36]OFW22034.1 MAG: hypothetical protein A3G21_13610 [Acidobacteria bacterium RIFCSPLOWO2_12_FULL_66_21]
MRRPFVTLTFTMALALVPAASFAQATATQQPPPAQQPPAQPPAAQPPAGPKLGFTTPAGLLLVQIKPDQTAVFEEMIGKLKAGLAKTDKPELKAQAAGFKVYKASEPMSGNALYVVVADPSSVGAEYALLNMLAATMTPDEQRTPEAAEMFKKYSEAFAMINRLNLTPIGGV